MAHLPLLVEGRRRDNLLQLQTVALEREAKNPEEFFSGFQCCAPKPLSSPAELWQHINVPWLEIAALASQLQEGQARTKVHECVNMHFQGVPKCWSAPFLL